MDPCPFVKILVQNLALKIPTSNRKHHCFCEIKLLKFPIQSAPIPIISNNCHAPESKFPAAGFSLSGENLQILAGKSKPGVSIKVYMTSESRTCGMTTRRLLGKVRVGLEPTDPSQFVIRSGWIDLASARLHLVVRVEPDPRFVFEFGGEPECSPVVYQIQGSRKQPVFSCKFSADRYSRSRSCSTQCDGTRDNKTKRRWLSWGGERERRGRERKGWMVIIHDLSGSPVAAASMITPFVASPGSNHVGPSNPGSWLILRPGLDGHWQPWGKLEAWREPRPVESLGYRFALVSSFLDSNSSIPMVESSLCLKKGGKFVIDTGLREKSSTMREIHGGVREKPKSMREKRGSTRVSSPSMRENVLSVNSGVMRERSWSRRESAPAAVEDCAGMREKPQLKRGKSLSFGVLREKSWSMTERSLSYGGMREKDQSMRENSLSWEEDSRGMIERPLVYETGFVMGSTVGGGPVVHVGLKHVMCVSDAAVFIALSAAIDLSVEACRLFSQKLRKDLCQFQ
ncbi:uncharacterized protein LOC18443471 [Amborella trichopoda]|nr:uncharacterized protein LOC18443471 [Amborella trichopoda]|eukprot:XP_020528625.1 uncharacterized protein LOC18443471 [Amborella trichopoda]